MPWVEPERDVTVRCGSTEAMLASMLGVLDPGDEVVVFEPFYENYGPDTIISGAVPRFVTLSPPDWTFDESELRGVQRADARHRDQHAEQPDRQGVHARRARVIAELCQRWDVLAITDEIYEHIMYDGYRHVPIASCRHGRSDGDDQRLSKTYA